MAQSTQAKQRTARFSTSAIHRYTWQRVGTCVIMTTRETRLLAATLKQGITCKRTGDIYTKDTLATQISDSRNQRLCIRGNMRGQTTHKFDCRVPHTSSGHTPAHWRHVHCRHTGHVYNRKASLLTATPAHQLLSALEAQRMNITLVITSDRDICTLAARKTRWRATFEKKQACVFRRRTNAHGNTHMGEQHPYHFKSSRAENIRHRLTCTRTDCMTCNICKH